jgi:hypothetical protein
MAMRIGSTAVVRALGFSSAADSIVHYGGENFLS